MRALPLVVSSLSLFSFLACSAAPDDAEGEAAESELRTKSSFVLAAADVSACVLSSNDNVPLAAGDCAAAPKLVFDAKAGTITPEGQKNRCLDVQFATKAAGAAIILHPCHGGSNQSWRLTRPLAGDAPLASAVRVEAYAKDGTSSLCLARRGDGMLIVDACEGGAGRAWLQDERVGERLRQRGSVATSLLTLGMIEPAGATTAPAAQRDKLAPAAGQLAADLVTRVMPSAVGAASPRVLVVLDDAHHNENSSDAALTADALRQLLTRTKVRLDVEVRAGVEITVEVVQAIVESELMAMSLTAVRERATVHLLVSIALVATTTRATVELVGEPPGGLTLDAVRMTDGRRPHVVWFSNPGHPIDSPASLATLKRFAERGGGVVVQGDDAAQRTAALTGLDLRAPWGEANGHVYCGKPFDNGGAVYPLESRELSLTGMIYTDDLDLARVVDPRVRVLATAKPACNGAVETVPAVVLLAGDR